MAEAFDPFKRPEFICRTRRHREINLLDRIYSGTQYDGRADWWTGTHGKSGTAVPLRERKPCVIYKLPKAAVQQVTRFLFGEKRFPRISIRTSEAEDESDDWYPELSEQDVELLDKWIGELVASSDLESRVRAVAEKAIACRTAVVIVELEKGEFKFKLPRPQDCHAEFADGIVGGDVTRLVWSYEFDKEVADETGVPTIKRHIFRREWDAEKVYVYPDVELKHGRKVEWPAPTETVHGLGFCPVIWIRNLGDYSQGLDGESLFDGMAEEFEALDMTLSRRHQGVIYLGAPQLVETGVEPDDGPVADGRRAGPEGFSSTNGEYAVAPAARRVAPDSVWTYQGKDVDVKLLETSGKAFEVGTNHVNDIRSRLLETMGVVLTSMADTVSRTSAGAEMSARFLALAHAPLIALVQEYRSPWWHQGLRRIVSMMMRMTVEKVASKELIMVPGTEAAAVVLEKFKTSSGWTTPRMTPHWGKFFEPSNTEIKTAVDTAVTARDGRIITTGTAVEYISHDFSIDSPQTEIDEIKSESAEAMKQAQQLAMASHQQGDGEPQEESQDGPIRSSNRRKNRRPAARKNQGSGRDAGKANQPGTAKGTGTEA